jgi:hypothetical protein
MKNNIPKFLQPHETEHVHRRIIELIEIGNETQTYVWMNRLSPRTPDDI